jgi:hypothetical protein
LEKAILACPSTVGIVGRACCAVRGVYPDDIGHMLEQRPRAAVMLGARACRGGSFNVAIFQKLVHIWQ